MPRIALIHALAESVEPINAAFERAWPAARRMNLLDDSLSADRAAGAALDVAMDARFFRLADHAVATGCDAILFTCSAFGSCIEAVARRHPRLPVMRPNEAMVAQAAAAGVSIGLVATFAPTLHSMPPEFPPGCELRTALAPGALESLRSGDGATHDRLVADAARTLAAEGCGVIALAQFSMARARLACERATALPVLTTADSAAVALRDRLESC